MPTKTASTPSPPPWPEIRIKSWAELQEKIDPLADRCVFRGQGSRDWPLLSSFNRVMPCADEAMALWWEFNSILRFRSEAHSYLPPTVMPPNMFKLAELDTYLEWLMLMQHFGAPTRLLDWSQSPFVAIYFAVIDCRADDAAIWYFETEPAEAAVMAHYGKGPGTFLDYMDFSSGDICDPDAKPLLYTAKKKMRTVREVAQQGVFTFVNRLGVNHQDIIAHTCRDHLFGRIVIPPELKLEFCWRLGQMNVTAASLFPGVEGVCSSIRDWLRLAVAQLPVNTPTTPPPPPPPPMPQAFEM